MWLAALVLATMQERPFLVGGVYGAHGRWARNDRFLYLPLTCCATRAQLLPLSVSVPSLANERIRPNELCLFLTYGALGNQRSCPCQIWVSEAQGGSLFKITWHVRGGTGTGTHCRQALDLGRPSLLKHICVQAAMWRQEEPLLRPPVPSRF